MPKGFPSDYMRNFIDNGDGTFAEVVFVSGVGSGGSIPSVLSASEAHVGSVGGDMNSVSMELTRPSDANAYAALDALADSTSAPAVVFAFDDIGRIYGGSGYLVKAQLMTDLKTCVARFRLHLFNAAPTAINDNSPYLTLYANAASRVGEIDFPACATENPTNSTQAKAQLVIGSGNLPLAFVLAADKKLYGLLETLDAFTPASGQKITIKLTADRN